MTNGAGGVETGDWTVLGGDAARIRDAVFVPERSSPIRNGRMGSNR